MAHRTISAEIWLYKDILYLRAYSITTDGIGYSLPNPIHVLRMENIDKLPEELMVTFSECEFDIIDSDHNTKQNNPLLDMMKMRSYRERDRKAKKISVYLQEDHILVHPMYFNGKYLTCRPEKYMFCSLDPEDIKKTVLEAFERCVPD